MIDQRFMQSLADDMKDPMLGEETTPEMVLAAGPARTDAPQAFVGTRLNVPRAGQPQPTKEERQRLGIQLFDSLAGMPKGVIQQTVGLPGDLESIGRAVLDYFGYDVNQETALPTTEDIAKRLESALGPVVPKGQTTIVPTAEREQAARMGETIGEFLPIAGIPEAVVGGVRMIGRAVQATKGMPIGMSIKLIDGTEAPIQKAPKVETKAFKTWFGKSKAVDEAGDPIVLYHGSDQSFDEFKGISWFTTSKSDASNYSNIITPGKEHTPNVMPVYLSIKKPKYIDGYATRQDVENAKASGKYDGVVVRNVMGSDKNYFITFEPTQVKSAIGNVGTFDPKDPSIVRGVAVGGGGGAVATQEENQ